MCVVVCERRCGECVVCNGTAVVVLCTCAAKTGGCRVPDGTVGVLKYDRHWS
jgi:hypothetical protein